MSINIINHQKFFFLHIPKTGGMAIENILFNNFTYDHKILKSKPRAFSFCIIRNPFDRLVSTYFYLKQGIGNSQDVIDAIHYDILKYDFHEWIYAIYRNPTFYLQQTHIMPMMDRIVDKNYIDYIGLYDNFDYEIQYLSNILYGKNIVTTISKINSSNHNNFESYYTDETKDIVYKIYQKDFIMYEDIVKNKISSVSINIPSNKILNKKSNKCIVSYAHGEHKSFLDTATPSFTFYANKHNYNLHIIDDNKLKDICNALNILDYEDRPKSWYKIPIIKYYLEHYDIVLWLDADVIITNFDNDISYSFQNNTKYIQAFVTHITNHTKVPNCGVWLLRPSAIELLDLIWNQRDLVHHSWWEQSAMLRCINWNIHAGNQYNDLNEYGKLSLELPIAFNMHKDDFRYNTINPIFFHATMFNDRQKIIEQQSRIANNNIHKNINSIYNTNFTVLDTRINLGIFIPDNARICFIGPDIDEFIPEILNNKSISELVLVDNFDQDKFSAGIDCCTEINMSSNEYKKYLNVKYKNILLTKYNNTNHSNNIPDNYFDFIYIDAYHSYSHCSKDLEFAYSKIKNNGYICGHDYNIIASKICNVSFYKKWVYLIVLMIFVIGTTNKF